MNLYHLIRPLIFRLDPENAHNLAINLLKFLPRFCSTLSTIQEYENLQSEVFGLNFLNPIGMSAGFDKNAEIISSLFRFGFGFVEAGTVTPKPQMGNEKPRIFRLQEDLAIINRLGFNGYGAEIFEKNLQAHLRQKKRIIGINIGKNKDSLQSLESDISQQGIAKEISPATQDYLSLLERFYGKVDYITINISSPNTKDLREIQNYEQLDKFLSIINTYKSVGNYDSSERLTNFANKIIEKDDFSKIPQIKPLRKPTPLLLKIAPDLSFKQQQDIAAIALKHRIDGLIISNTTIARDFGLKSKNALEAGGLSGKPLFTMSNEVLSSIFKLTNGTIPIIGVGGISSAADAFEKIRCGASLVQIYSAFIFEGFGLVERIKAELSYLIKKNGFRNITAAIGSKF